MHHFALSGKKNCEQEQAETRTKSGETIKENDREQGFYLLAEIFITSVLK